MALHALSYAENAISSVTLKVALTPTVLADGVTIGDVGRDLAFGCWSVQTPWVGSAPLGIIGF